MSTSLKIVSLCLFILITACSTGSKKPPPDLLKLTEAQMKIRSFQSRSFDLTDQHKTLRAVVSTLLDLGFIVERVNAPMGLVTAAKFATSGAGFVEATVMVRPKGESQLEVRANALLNTQPVDDPKAYQDFFAALHKSLFMSQ